MSNIQGHFVDYKQVEFWLTTSAGDGMDPSGLLVYILTSVGRLLRKSRCVFWRLLPLQSC